ncbi:hypothetical protein SAY87_028222 [Trapa incisa]|uniref:Transcription repressor n=1 Tax=Trapa incisa TaxID=236973 RepID=A0AAN7KNZ3_9MYRT|nr:hypothetical protein SAY87_028222 [Trapa incisa]
MNTTHNQSIKRAFLSSLSAGGLLEGPSILLAWPLEKPVNIRSGNENPLDLHEPLEETHKGSCEMTRQTYQRVGAEVTVERTHSFSLGALTLDSEMSNTILLWKNFHLCFFKFKCLLPPQSPPSLPPSHPPPPEEYYALVTAPASVNTTITTSSYENSSNHSTFLTPNTTEDPFLASSDNGSDFSAAAASMPDLASIYSNQRFFFSSPGRSNSILDSSESPPPPSTAIVAGTGGFTVQKYSSDPCGDFQRSMQEMIEARDIKDLNDDSWEYLHELLLCYMAVNPKQTRKFILEAFTDIVLLLMSRPPPQPPRADLAVYGQTEKADQFPTQQFEKDDGSEGLRRLTTINFPAFSGLFAILIAAGAAAPDDIPTCTSGFNQV